jgi:hypothetical protein
MNWGKRADALRQALEEAYSADRSGKITWRMAADAVASALELDEFEATYVVRLADGLAADDADLAAAEAQRQHAADRLEAGDADLAALQAAYATTYHLWAGLAPDTAAAQQAAWAGTWLLFESNGGELWTTPSLSAPPLPAYCTDCTDLADAALGLGTWPDAVAATAAGNPPDWKMVAGYVALPGTRCVSIWQNGTCHYDATHLGPNGRVALGLDCDPPSDPDWAEAVAALAPNMLAYLAATAEGE